MEPFESPIYVEPYRNTDNTGAKVIDMAQMPPFSPSAFASPTVQIATYLKMLVDETQKALNRQCVILPSLMSLSQLFEADQGTVQRAFRELRHEGYYNFTPGLYGPITLWDRGVAQLPPDIKQEFPYWNSEVATNEWWAAE